MEKHATNFSGRKNVILPLVRGKEVSTSVAASYNVRYHFYLWYVVAFCHFHSYLLLPDERLYYIVSNRNNFCVFQHLRYSTFSFIQKFTFLNLNLGITIINMFTDTYILYTYSHICFKFHHFTFYNFKFNAKCFFFFENR